MTLSNLLRKSVVAIIVTLLYPMAVALSQDSVESVTTITKEEGVQISNVDDWDFGFLGLDDLENGEARFEDDICVFSSTGSFSLTVDSQTSINRLRLRGDGGDTIRFTLDVRFSNGNTTLTRRVSTKGTTIRNMMGSSVRGCADVGNSNISVVTVVNSNQFNRAAPGIYRDVVTLLVTPE